MKIIANRAREFEFVRDLTEAEISDHAKYTPIIGEARDRLKLFKILQENYREWREYLNSLLSPQTGDHEEEAIELDRLLLNYLTCAYTIREHFEVSFVQRFRKNATKRNGHKDFICTLCTKSWAFAFFLDFRGYVQHRGLGIGGYSRKISSKSVSISITYEAAKLFKESRDWRHSRLSGSEGSLDLISLLREFHVQMLQSYAKFVGETLFPELIEAAAFYNRLAKEVEQNKPGFRMFLADGEPKINENGNNIEFSLKLEYAPNDLFSELGISVPRNVQM